jgi:hypothetical protein
MLTATGSLLQNSDDINETFFLYREIISLRDENTANARWEPAGTVPSRGSGDRRAVCDYKNVRNTYQITINVESDLHPLAHTPDTAVQGL